MDEALTPAERAWQIDFLVGITEGLDGELIAFARERISHVKAPREVEFVERLPRTESGKLLKRVLLEA